MIDITYFAGPVMGGVIGYITNALAIRMLFRPYNAKYIGNWRVPFTPGIIPKEKTRIAAAIGTAITDNLMSKDVVEKTLLEEKMINKIRGAVLSIYYQQQHNTQSIRELLSEYLTADVADNIVENIKEDLSLKISAEIASSEVSGKIADAVSNHLLDKIRSNNPDMEGLSAISGMFKFNPVRNKVADMLEAPVKKFLIQNIEKILQRNGRKIAEDMLDEQIEKFADTPVSEVLADKDEDAFRIADGVVNIYQTIIKENLPRILDSIDISNMIENRINEMDMEETERLIFQVMNKELKAIIWLGALLGTLMGTVNVFI